MSEGQLAFNETRQRLYGTSERYIRLADRREVDWMVRRHYLGKWPGVTVAILGLFTPHPSGVCVFSLPPSETFTRYGGLTWELGRLWVSDDQPRNTESWFVSRAIRYVWQFHRDVVALVSYADPSAGHSGVIYRASNWEPDGMTDEGRSTPRFDYRLAGKTFARKAHVPPGVEADRIPRVSKHRYVWRFKRGPRLSRASYPNVGTPEGVAGPVYDPFGAAHSDTTTGEAA